jgi:hypothetical protein
MLFGIGVVDNKKTRTLNIWIGDRYIGISHDTMPKKNLSLLLDNNITALRAT